MITSITINVDSLDNEERRIKAQECASAIHQVINSTIFRDRIMKMDFRGETSEFKNITNSRLYQMLMNGAEETSPEVDNDWDIWVDDYFTRRGVIGYMIPNKKWMYVNTKFFDSRSNKKAASNIVHEYGHTLGFRHDRSRTARRPYSVCYQLNKIFEECYDKIIGSQASLVKVKLPKQRFWHKSKYEWVRKYI